MKDDEDVSPEDRVVASSIGAAFADVRPSAELAEQVATAIARHPRTRRSLAPAGAFVAAACIVTAVIWVASARQQPPVAGPAAPATDAATDSGQEPASALPSPTGSGANLRFQVECGTQLEPSHYHQLAEWGITLHSNGQALEARRDTSSGRSLEVDLDTQGVILDPDNTVIGAGLQQFSQTSSAQSLPPGTAINDDLPQKFLLCPDADMAGATLRMYPTVTIDPDGDPETLVALSDPLPIPDDRLVRVEEQTRTSSATSERQPTTPTWGQPVTSPVQGRLEPEASFQLRQLLYRIGAERLMADHNIGDRAEFHALLRDRWIYISRTSVDGFQLPGKTGSSVEVSGVPVDVVDRTVGATLRFVCHSVRFEIASTPVGAERFSAESTEVDPAIEIARLVIAAAECSP